MNEEMVNRELNRLLGQPMQIADHNFARQVCSRLQKSEAQRTRIFFIVGACCLSLFLLAGASTQFPEIFNTIEIAWNNLLEGFIQILPLKDSTLAEAFSNIPRLGTLAATLGILAVILKLAEE